MKIPDTLGQLIHVHYNIFSRVKCSGMIPGDSQVYAGTQLREGEQHLPVIIKIRNLCR